MYQLVYVSEATEAFPSDCLEDLLKLARAKNKIKGITGMLVSYDKLFLQVLEGNPADVIGMYDHLAKDPRHDNLIVLHRGYAAAPAIATANTIVWMTPRLPPPPRGNWTNINTAAVVCAVATVPTDNSANRSGKRANAEPLSGCKPLRTSESKK